MHWGQSVECVACIHLVTPSRSRSEVQMEVHCWLLQHPFMSNNKQSEMIHISFSTVLFGCLMDAVVLNAQASASSRLSTCGTARCTLFSLWRRTLPWFLQSPMAATGNIWESCSGNGCFFSSPRSSCWYVIVPDIMAVPEKYTFLIKNI